MDVHLRDLRYFIAVAQHLHFTRAAETLYVSQPALSKQIRALERQLRVTLFERDHGTVRLTRAGTELLPHAERMVASWESAKSALSKASDCALVIGMHTSPGRGLLPKVRAMMVANCPEAELELRQVPWSDRTAGLADRSTDAAFVWLPLPQPPYRWVTIARETRLVALANDHRLAARESVAMADLFDEPFLALPASAGPLRDFWLARDERAGHPVRIAAEINDTEETYEAVAGGIGICLLAAGNAPIFARGAVTMLPVADLAPCELVLAWNERHCPPLLETFAALCEQVVTGAYTSSSASDSVGSRRLNHSDSSAASASAPRDSRSASSCASP
jgi:DNA-binding transcriptional LysR family regulator